MPRFGSELWFEPKPWFEPEPSRTGPKFGPGFGVGAELDQRSHLGFGGGRTWQNHSEPGPNPEPKVSMWSGACALHVELYFICPQSHCLCGRVLAHPLLVNCWYVLFFCLSC